MGEISVEQETLEADSSPLLTPLLTIASLNLMKLGSFSMTVKVLDMSSGSVLNLCHKWYTVIKTNITHQGRVLIPGD